MPVTRATTINEVTMRLIASMARSAVQDPPVTLVTGDSYTQVHELRDHGRVFTTVTVTTERVSTLPVVHGSRWRWWLARKLLRCRVEWSPL